MVTFKVLGTMLILFLVTPYFISIPKQQEITTTPFDNSFFLEVEGVNIHYRVWSEIASDKKALLVHGLAGSTFTFRKVTDILLEEGYEVIAVDLPGFGYSDRTRGINHSQQNRAKLLKGVMEHLENDEENVKWLLLGHSLGGGTLTQLTIDYPQKVESLIIVAGAVYSRPTRFSQQFFKVAPFSRWFQVVARYFLITEPRIKTMLGSAYGRTPTSHEVRGYLEPLRIGGTEGSFIDLTISLKTIDEHEIQNISVPTLIIWGEEDMWVKIEQGYRLNGEIKDSKFEIIKKSGHCPMETHDTKFNEILKSFLRNQ